MRQNTPDSGLDNPPPLREKVESLNVLKQVNQTSAALAELRVWQRSSPINRC